LYPEKKLATEEMTTSNKQLTILIFLGIILFFTSLGAPYLWDIDEPNNTEATREMIIRGDYVTPYFNGKLRTDKPIMIYWFQAAAIAVFGQTEFAARFFSAVFGLLTIGLVFIRGRQLFSPRVGLYAALILVTSLQFNTAPRFANPDAYLVFWIAFSLFGLMLFQKTGAQKYLLHFYLGMGLGMLAKGPIAIVLPGGIAFFSFLAAAEWRTFWRKYRVLAGALLTLAIGLSWYIWVGIETDGAFLRGFFLEHNMERFTDTREGHSGNVLYYILVAIIGFLPWGFFTFLFWTGKDHLKNNFAIQTLWLWALTFILFFTVSSTKLPNYILPAIPPLAVMLGFRLNLLLEKSAKLRWHIGNGIILILGFGVLGAALLALPPQFAGFTFDLIVLSVPLILMGITGFVFISKQQLRYWFYATAALAAIFLLIISNLIIPQVNHYRTIPIFARTIAATEKKPVMAYRYFQPSLVYYTEPGVQRYDKAAIAAENIQTEAWVVTKKKYLSELRPYAAQLDIVDARKGFYTPDTLVLGRISFKSNDK
jgi:4-amino-4-deoxy-L-arabinose transferase-like glycosyltransferase